MRRGIPWIIGLAALVGATAPAAARQPDGSGACVGGACVGTIRLDAKRVPVLRQAGTAVQRAKTPSYVALYRTGFKGARIEQGALMVGAVDTRNVAVLNPWLEHVGKQSIGFIADSGPDGKGIGSGHVRVGTTFIPYTSLKPGGATGRVGQEIKPLAEKGKGLAGRLKYAWKSLGSGYNPVNGYTEATFLAEPQEITAIMAFYQARANGLIKSPGAAKGQGEAMLHKDVAVNLPAEGATVKPEWSMKPADSGKKMETLQTDACAGRASSVLNHNWRKLFAWNVRHNLAEIRAYGQKKGIAELANLDASAAQHIDGFMQRYFGSATAFKQSNEPKGVLRKTAPHCSMLTTFNRHDNPMQSLEWNLTIQKYVSSTSGRSYADRDTIGYYRFGGGQPYAIFDWKPGQRAAMVEAAARSGSGVYQPPQFDGERLPVQSLMQQLGTSLPR